MWKAKKGTDPLILEMLFFSGDQIFFDQERWPACPAPFMRHHSAFPTNTAQFVTASSLSYLVCTHLLAGKNPIQIPVS